MVGLIWAFAHRGGIVGGSLECDRLQMIRCHHAATRLRSPHFRHPQRCQKQLGRVVLCGTVRVCFENIAPPSRGTGTSVFPCPRGGVYVASDGVQHPLTVIAIEHGALRPPAYRTDDDLII